MDGLDKAKKKICRTYNDAAAELASRKNWHGHNGGDFSNDTALYNALKGNGYNGEWFIPPCELVYGKDVDENVVRQDNNLYALRNTSDFQKPEHAFTTTTSGFDDAHWYWSCTERRGCSLFARIVDFADGNVGADPKNLNSLSTRPCRVELAL